jgi:hypothetical protein
MEIRNIAFIALSIFSLATIPSCHSSANGNGLTAVEDLSENDFNKWKLYVELGVKIGANRLIEEQKVSREELTKVSDAMDLVLTQPATTVGQMLLQKALIDSGIHNDEIRLILAIAENEIISRSGYQYVNLDGIVNLTPRTRELLMAISFSLRTAGKAPVTSAEKAYIQKVKASASIR